MHEKSSARVSQGKRLVSGDNSNYDYVVLYLSNV